MEGGEGTKCWNSTGTTVGMGDVWKGSYLCNDLLGGAAEEVGDELELVDDVLAGEQRTPEQHLECEQGVETREVRSAEKQSL